MSDYTPVNNFSAKDDLPAGFGGEKLVLGEEWDEETAAIQTAIATKYDSDDLADQSEAEAGSSSTVVMTPLRLTQFFTAQADDRGLNYDQENWDRDVLGSDVNMDTGYSDWTTVQDDLSLALAGLYEFEYVGWITRDSNVLFNWRIGGFSVTPTFWQAGLSGIGSSAFNLEYTDDGETEGIRTGTITGEYPVIVRGLIRVSTPATLDVQVKKSFSSGSTGDLTLKGRSHLRWRRLVDNS